MQPADDIKKLIDESQITSSSQADRRILADALEDLEKRRAAEATGQPGAWRILMNSKWSKFAVAAAVVIAVLIGLQFLGNPLGSNLTFAQVIQPILNASTAVLDVIVGEEAPDTPVIHDMVMGSRIRRTVSNTPELVSIIDLQTGRTLVMDESKKEAQYLTLKGLPSKSNYLDYFKNLFVTLQESPHFTTKDLGVQQIDGREAVGFRATNPRVEIVLWADAKTGLPIRIESKEPQLNVICKNVQFDVPIEEAMFSMEPPDGYKVQAQTIELDLFGSTEADFVEGLRVMAQTYGDGQFPDGVGVEDVQKLVPVMRKKSEELHLSSEEETALGVKIQRWLMFTRFFQGADKWYYRGKGVTLGETDKAIFWYRPKGSKTYRVIYGDLHVEDVAPENLPEPLPPVDVVEPGAGYQQWSKPEFVGSQEDFCYVQPDGKVRVGAYLTLLRGPNDTSLMPIRLPYPKAPLELVKLSGPGQKAEDFLSLSFRKTGEGAYNIELPLDKLLAGQTILICQWHVPLDEFSLERGKYWTDLQSLIPVISYRLRVGVDPNSGFELTLPPTDTWAAPFTSAVSEEPRTQFGRCTLVIRKRE